MGIVEIEKSLMKSLKVCGKLKTTRFRETVFQEGKKTVRKLVAPNLHDVQPISLLDIVLQTLGRSFPPIGLALLVNLPPQSVNLGAL